MGSIPLRAKVARVSGSRSAAFSTALTRPATGAGRPGGPCRDHQPTTSTCGTPASAMLGTSGSTSLRPSPVMPRPTIVPASMCGRTNWVW